MCAVIIGMSLGTSFAFDPLPATRSATGPQPSPVPEDHGKPLRLCSKKCLTASHSRSNDTMVELGEGRPKKMQSKVELLFFFFFFETPSGTEGVIDTLMSQR